MASRSKWEAIFSEGVVQHMGFTRGRGRIATLDMKARLQAGWTIDQLWERNREAELGDGFSYDMAESLSAESNSEVEELDRVGAARP